VVEEEHMQEALKTAQALQEEEEDLGEVLEPHRDVRINWDPKRWVEDPFLVIDPFIAPKVSLHGRFWENIFSTMKHRIVLLSIEGFFVYLRLSVKDQSPFWMRAKASTR
jgi:hypothetical protein